MSTTARNQVDHARRDRAMNSAACPLCGAEAGDPCTGWKDPNSQALHEQRWIAARVSQTADPRKATVDIGTTIATTPKRTSDEVLAVIIVAARTSETDIVLKSHGFRWTPPACAYVNLFVDAGAAAKNVARQLADQGYAVKLHAARPHEVLCWDPDMATFNNGARDVVRRLNR